FSARKGVTSDFAGFFSGLFFDFFFDLVAMSAKIESLEAKLLSEIRFHRGTQNCINLNFFLTRR
ncbi:MAG TPA: hypothetical protein PKC82_10085, partial [Chitinophagaceae bacterium]|nr:hypothetical protein [Chitinophagaceae bacterium]